MILKYTINFFPVAIENPVMKKGSNDSNSILRVLPTP